MRNKRIVAASLVLALGAGASPVPVVADEFAGLEAGIGADEKTGTEEPSGEPPAETDAVPGETVEIQSEPMRASDATATILRGGARIACDDLAEAIDLALDGDTIAISGEHVVEKQVTIGDGRSLALIAEGPATIKRGGAFPTSGGKVVGLVRLDGASSLTLGSADPATGSLILDGDGRDSDDAIVTLHGKAALTMGEGSAIMRAHCSWKPWGAVYVRSGSFVLDGGEIRDGLAMRNTAVAVEAGSSFEMRAGSIEGNRATYSESIVWTKGDAKMTGGTITDNRSNVSNDGVVYVLSGGKLTFAGGTIGDNAPNNKTGILVDAGGSLSLGANACLEGADRIALRSGSALSIADAPRHHSTDDPIEIVLMDEWGVGRAVASCSSEGTARAALAALSVVSGGNPEGIVSVGTDPADPSLIAVVNHDAAEYFSWLDDPFADNLCLEPRAELQEAGAFDRIAKAIELHFADVDMPERRLRTAQLERIRTKLAYLATHHGEAASSVCELSQLGEAGAERRRTKQSYTFDNLDATGYYLKPGRVHELNFYLDADDPSKVALAWRQAGLTDTNSYTALNTRQHTGLVNGENRISIDLTGSTYGFMVYLRNDSSSNRARARIESADALQDDGTPVVGSSLGTHPIYLHDTEDPAAFWDFVLSIRAHAGLVRSGQAEDMALIQMGDAGHAQFSISATALEAAYASIASPDDAITYIERSNQAIQDRLAFFWTFDGFDRTEQGGPNAVTPMRVHTAFTRTVRTPSTMYAFERYFHMPESTAAPFLSGENMYGWGMSHEYGHCLDNSVIAVAEQTNNLYSIAGARHGGIQSMQAGGEPFNPDARYHVNAMSATRRRDADLARMAADPSYVPDWNNGNDWGTYIWTHLTAWWGGLSFFDDWDYSDYRFDASPYTKDIAADVGRYGAYGASLRILRSDTEAVRTIENLTAGISDHDTRKYNRIAMAFTMGTGYDFAAYLHALGERDLTDEVRAFCARYPAMPRKVQYHSLQTDAALINGGMPYETGATPIVTASVADGEAHIQAHMPTEQLEASTVAYELYRKDELVGFSRTGSFTTPAAPGDSPADFSVLAYDVRLNPSSAGHATDAPFTAIAPDLTMGDGPAALIIDGPEGATYTFESSDGAIVAVDGSGMLTPHAAGTARVTVTMTWKGQTSEPIPVEVTVRPRPIVLTVNDAETFTGSALPQPGITVSGQLLEGDSLGDLTYRIRTEDENGADLDEPGVFPLYVEATGLGQNYEVTVRPGTLTVRQEALEANWIRMFGADGSELDGDAWSKGKVALSLTAAKGDAGTYDLLALDEETPAYSSTVVIDAEGETAPAVRAQASSGNFAGATTSAGSVRVRIDNTAPIVGASSKDGRISIDATDTPAEGANASSGISSITVRVLGDDGTVAEEHRTEGDALELALVEPGTFHIEATACDNAGNVSETVMFSVDVPADDVPGEGDDGGTGPEAGAPDGEDGESPDNAPNDEDNTDETPEDGRPDDEDSNQGAPGDDQPAVDQPDEGAPGETVEDAPSEDGEGHGPGAIPEGTTPGDDGQETVPEGGTLEDGKGDLAEKEPSHSNASAGNLPATGDQPVAFASAALAGCGAALIWAGRTALRHFRKS